MAAAGRKSGCRQADSGCPTSRESAGGTVGLSNVGQTFLALTLGYQALCPHVTPQREQAQKGTLDKAFPWEGAIERMIVLGWVTCVH